LKSPENGEDLFVVVGQELPLSGAAMIQLMQAVLDKGLAFRFRAKGYSMSPFIKDSDVITVLPLRTVPRLGEVVAFRHPVSRRLVVHRVIRARNDGCLIRGDAVSEMDGLVPRAHILGRVERVERDGKSVRLGMGPERALIAFLTRTGLFMRVIIPLWMRIRPIVRPNRRSA
jgi:hypothetical protein